jgi:peptide/nickel transport system permease protein
MSRRALTAYVLRRLLVLVALLFLISLIVFGLLYAAPGSVEQVLMGTRPPNPETIAAIREQHHLDESFVAQYWLWLKDAVQLDFGRSIRTSEPVLSSITDRLYLSTFLGVYGFVIAVGIGVPLGVLAALRQRTALDRSVVGLSVVGVSAPAFATGIALLYLFAVVLGWFPVFGPGEGFVDRLWHLALPAFALALTAMALLLKLTRAAMIVALGQDYVTFARARGMSGRRVIFGYALRNALIPVVTSAGLVFGYMLTGALLVEVTFALPGIGSLFVESVNFRDIPMVQGLAMAVAILIILVNLVTDILYLYLDPRIRFDRVAS